MLWVLTGRRIAAAVNRLLIPLALLAVCLGSFWLSDRLGNDPELESLDVDITSPEVPLLSARRIPEFLTLPISQERLEADLDEVADDSPVLTCLAVAEADGGTVVISEGAEGLLYDPVSYTHLTLPTNREV